MIIYWFKFICVYCLFDDAVGKHGNMESSLVLLPPVDYSYITVLSSINTQINCNHLLLVMSLFWHILISINLGVQKFMPGVS